MTSFLHGFVAAARADRLTADHPEDQLSPGALLRDVIPESYRVLYVTPSFVESRHLVGLVVDRDGRATAVAKTPRRAWDTESVRHEAAVLVELARAAPELTATIPQVLVSATWHDRPVLLELMLTGAPLTHARAGRDSRSTDALLRWIAGLPRTGESTGADLLASLLDPDLAWLRRLAPAGHPLLELAQRTEREVEPLRDAVLPRVFEHGDPSHPNLLVTRSGHDRGIGVVDWELARPDGAPGHDLAQCLAFVCFARARAHGRAAESAAFHAWFGRPGDIGSRQFAASLVGQGIAQGLVRPLFVLAWARAALRLLPRMAPEHAPSRHPPSRTGHGCSDSWRRAATASSGSRSCPRSEPLGWWCWSRRLGHPA